MFSTMFSTFAKSDISKYGHSSENAEGNIILTNCALEKRKIPIFVEQFTKPLRINSLIESSVIVWRMPSAFQILIQKGHMNVYVPYSKISKILKSSVFVEKSNKFCKKNLKTELLWILYSAYVGSNSGKIARMNFRPFDGFNKLGFNRKDLDTQKKYLGSLSCCVKPFFFEAEQ